MKKIILLSLIFFLFSLNIAAQGTQLPGPGGTQVNVIRKNNNFVYAGTESKGVFRSSDNGASWQMINNGIANDVKINDILLYGNYVFAAVSSSCPGLINIYRSSNNGSSWAVSGNGIPNKIASSFAVKGNSIWTGVSTYNESGIYRSNDS